jgi:hypothetical protein
VVLCEDRDVRGEPSLERITVTLLFRHDDKDKEEASFPVVMPEYMHDIFLGTGYGYDMIMLQLPFAVFMNAPLLTFVHCLYYMMFVAGDTRKERFPTEPATISHFREGE